MSDTYVTLKVREALKAAGGSKGQAQRNLIAMALDDEQLLRGLCQPFLKAIAASAVERVAREARPMRAPGQVGTQTGGQIAVSRSAGRSQKKLSTAALDALVLNIGRDDTPTPLAKAESGAEVTPDQASALKALAAAYRGRK